jgi:RNA polymerase-binding transcription factor DksA
MEQKYNGKVKHQLSPNMDIIDMKNTTMQRSLRTDQETVKQHLYQTVNDSWTKIATTNTHDCERTENEIVGQLLFEIVDGIATK